MIKEQILPLLFNLPSTSFPVFNSKSYAFYFSVPIFSIIILVLAVVLLFWNSLPAYAEADPKYTEFCRMPFLAQQPVFSNCL